MPSRRDLLVYSTVVAMEALAGFALVLGVNLLDVARLGYSSFWLFLLAALAGMVVGLLVSAAGPGEPWNRLLLLAGAVLLIAPSLLGIAHSVAGYIVTGLLLAVFYWRGLAASQETPGLNEVRGHFGQGFAVLFLGFICVIARGILNNGSIWHVLAIDGIAYTVLAMIAMVAARTEGTREPGSGPAVALAVTVQLGLLTVLALIAVQVFSLDLAGAVGRFTQPFWDAIGSAGFHLVTLVAKPIDWLVGLIRPHPHSLVRPRVAPPGSTNPTQHKLVRPHNSGDPLVVAIGLVLLALIVGAVAYGIYRALPQISRRQMAAGFVEERRSVWSASELWRVFVTWLRSLGRRSTAVAVTAIRRTRRRVFGEYPADPVRRVYAQLLRRAAANGLPRPADVTPGEYQARLIDRWPAGSAHFAMLTDAYILRRYGETTFAQAQIDDLKVHWHAARTTIRRPRIVTDPELSAMQTGQSPLVGSSLITIWMAGVRRMVVTVRIALLGDRDLSLARSVFLLLACFVAPIVALAGIIIVLTVIGGH